VGGRRGGPPSRRGSRSSGGGSPMSRRRIPRVEFDDVTPSARRSHMKRVLGAAAGLVTILALIGVPAPAALAYATGTSYPLITVDNSAGDQSQPHVSGHYASYNVTSTDGYDDW